MTAGPMIERFAALGTRVELHVFDPGTAPPAALAAARRAIEAVDDALTIHRSSPTTALNEELLAGRPATITSAILFEAVVAAANAHNATLGLFDIVADLRTGATWAAVRFDRRGRTIAVARPLALDFGGIGKGLALDHAAAVLRAAGVQSALLSAGESSLAVIGEHPLGGSWPFAIPHPLCEGEALLTVELAADAALSVSATVGAGVTAPDRAAMLRPGAAAISEPCCAVAIADSATAAEAMSTALIVADRIRAERLLQDGRATRFRFDLDALMPDQPLGMVA